MVRYTATMAIILAVAVACGGGHSAGSVAAAPTAPASRHISTAALTSCLQAAGARVETHPPEDSGTLPWREEGDLEAHLGPVDVFLGVMATERGARYQLAALVGLAGGGPTVDGDPIEDHMGRVANVAVLYSSVPDDGTREAVEGCLGGALRLDPVKL